MFVFHQLNSLVGANPMVLDLCVAFAYAFVVGYLLHRILSGMAIGLAGKITLVFISIAAATWMAPAGVTARADQEMLALITSTAMIGAVLLISANTIKILVGQARNSSVRWGDGRSHHQGTAVARGAHCVIR